MGNPVQLALQLAEEYIHQHDIPPHRYVSFSEDEAIQSADFYEKMDHIPEHPIVKASYEVFTKHLCAQFLALRRTGFTLIPQSNYDYPSSDVLRDDMRDGKMIYLPTAANIGSVSEMPSDHPLAGTVKVEGEEYCLNDVFRIVHDFYGHGAGHSFSPRGEHEAWNAHRSTLPVTSHLALWCETRGQSSWVNFGKHVRGSFPPVPPPERPFAEQKCGIPPTYLT